MRTHSHVGGSLSIALLVAAFGPFMSVPAAAAHVTVWTWGINAAGQLGNANIGVASPTPTQSPVISGVVAISAEEGSDHPAVLKSDGTVWNWGTNTGNL